MATVFATVSTPGPPGAPGTPGYSPVYIVAPGPPSGATGNNNDMYINSLNGDVYGPKTAGAWGAVACNIKGSTGAAGTPGAPGGTGPAGYSPQYHVASGVPSSGLGNNGDMYINSTTSDVYGPKTAGAWGTIQCNIKGQTGATGPPGAAYTPRGAWVSTTTYAQGDEVTDVSILYISLQSGNLNHVPASSPTWWQALSGGGGAAQTPWLSNIDGAAFELHNAGRIGVSTAAPEFAVDVWAPQYTQLAFRHAAGEAGGYLSCYEAASFVVAAGFKSDSTGTGWISDIGNWSFMWLAQDRISFVSKTGDPVNGPAVLPPETFSIQGPHIGVLVGNPQFEIHIGKTADQTVAATYSNMDNAAIQFYQAQNFPGSSNYNRILDIVAGGGNAGGCIRFSTQVGTGASVAVMVVAANANVGIGTMNPLTTLHVEGGTGFPIGVLVAQFVKDQTTKQGIILGYDSSAQTAFIYSSSAGAASAMAFVNYDGSAWGERMRIAPSGVVCINTATPVTSPGAYWLTVAGNLRNIVATSSGSEAGICLQNTATGGRAFSLFSSGGSSSIGQGCFSIYDEASATNRFLIAFDGKIGINETVPQDQLAINCVAFAANVTGGIRLKDPGANWVGRLLIKSNSGGSPRFTLDFNANEVFSISGTSVGINKSYAAYALDVVGDVNCSGAFRVGGVAISAGGGISTQSVVTPSRVIGTVYQNTTGKAMMVTVTGTAASGTGINGFTDTSTTPTQAVAISTNQNATNGNVCISFWVLNNSYYKVTGSITLNLWIEWT